MYSLKKDFRYNAIKNVTIFFFIIRYMGFLGIYLPKLFTSKLRRYNFFLHSVNI